MSNLFHARTTSTRCLRRALYALSLSLVFQPSQNAVAQNAVAQNAVVQSAVVQSGTRRETIANARWIWNVDRTSPRVAFSVLVRAGAADESYESAGLRRVLAEAMLRATVVSSANLRADEKAIVFQSADEREKLLESLGARLGASVNDDAIEFWATCDSVHAPRVLDVLLNVLQAPRLVDEDVAAARLKVRAQRESTFNDVASLATEALDTRLYRDFANRPIAYGLPDVGSSAALQNLDAARLRTFHSRFFRPSEISLGASGDLDVIGLRAQLQSRFKAWNASSVAATTPRAPLFSAVVAPETMSVTRDLGGVGDWVFTSYRVSDAAQNDLPALNVLAAALGASPEGRVPQRLLRPSSTRSSTDVAQQASVVLVPRRWGGELVLFAQTLPRVSAAKTSSAERLQKVLEEEATRLRTQVLTSEELGRARRYAIGSWSLDRESLRARAFRLALDEEWQSAASTRPVWMPSASSNTLMKPSENAFEYSNWVARVQGVTAAQVQNVAKRYLNVGATVYIRSGAVAEKE